MKILWATGLTVAAIGMTGCSSTPTPSPPPQTVTVTAPTTTDATNPSTDTETVAAESLTAASPVEASESTAGPAIDADDRGRPLPLDRFLQLNGQWHANQFAIADKTGIQGIATETTQCSEDGAPTLEVRLGNHFQEVNLRVGISNDGSESSDQRAVVQIIGNGSVLSVNRVPFNKIQPITVDVKNVNALKVRVHLDPEVEQCGSGAAQIVLSDIRVS